MTNNTKQTNFQEKISIIIVNYKSEEPLLLCLEEIYKSIDTTIDLETIIINNGTKNRKLLNKISNLTNVILIDTKRNIGFASGVNIGLSLASNNLILLLNPDTFVNFNSIKQLVNCLRDNKAGIVGGASFDLSGEKQNSFVRKPNIFIYLFDYTNLRKLLLRDSFHKKHYYLDEPYPTSNKVVDAVSGSFMLIDKKVIEVIGKFDERFFMYLEDVDYCLRANSAGFKVVFCPNSKIKHIGGFSSRNKERVNMNAWLVSRCLFVLKHANLVVNLLVQPVFLFDAGIIKLLQIYKKWKKGK